MEGTKTWDLMNLRTPLIGIIISGYLNEKELKNINKFILNKKLFKLTIEYRFKKKQIKEIKEISKIKEYEVNFGIIIFCHLKNFNRDLIAVAGLSGGLEIINFKTNERSNEIILHSDTINSIVDFERENMNILASSSYDHTIKFLNLQTLKPVFSPINCEFIVYFMKVIKIYDKIYFLTSTFQSYNLRCINTMDSLYTVKLHGNYIYKVIQTKALNPESFLTCSYDGTIRFSNCKSTKNNSTLAIHNSAVWGLGYLKRYNKEMCISGSWDHTIKIYNFVKNELIKSISTDPNNAKHFCQFPFLKNRIVLISHGGKIQFYDLIKNELIYEFQLHTKDIYWFAALKDENNNYCFISSSIDRKLIFQKIS